jgi:hypothetical protein
MPAENAQIQGFFQGGRSRRERPGDRGGQPKLFCVGGSFDVLDRQGEVVCTFKSKWMCIDMVRKE